jgi:hypothetical protein
MEDFSVAVLRDTVLTFGRLTEGATLLRMSYSDFRAMAGIEVKLKDERMRKLVKWAMRRSPPEGSFQITYGATEFYYRALPLVRGD